MVEEKKQKKKNKILGHTVLEETENLLSKQQNRSCLQTTNKTAVHFYWHSIFFVAKYIFLNAMVVWCVPDSGM